MYALVSLLQPPIQTLHHLVASLHPPQALISKARTNVLYLVKTNAASQYSEQSKKLLYQLHMMYMYYAA